MMDSKKLVMVHCEDFPVYNIIMDHKKLVMVRCEDFPLYNIIMDRKKLVMVHCEDFPLGIGLKSVDHEIPKTNINLPYPVCAGVNHDLLDLNESGICYSSLAHPAGF